MTRDEIMKLQAGRELDELIVQKIFGYEKLPFPAVPKFQKPTESGFVHVLFNALEYSTEIAAAWEVIEKLSDRFYTSINNDLGIWNVDFWSDWNEGDDEPCHPAQADTAPLAICRAALLAKGE